VRRVDIVSARPVAFLHDRLGDAGPLTLHGLYGLETQRAGGPAETHPDARAWAPLILELTGRARAELPPDVRIEYKRLAVGLHYRGVPERQAGIERWSQEQAGRYGLLAQQGRLVVELRPPVRRDKGDVVREELGDLRCAWYAGDDVSDGRGFEALTEREAAGDGFQAVRVAIANPETGRELARAADLRVDSPAALVALLRDLAGALAVS
jgi:trehalose 6-phosphate phosphatase